MAASEDLGGAAGSGSALPGAPGVIPGTRPSGSGLFDQLAGGGHRRPSRPARAWRAFREWRRRRPFLGGLLILLGGAEILLTEIAPMRVTIHLGAEGLAGEAVPVVLMLCGLLLLVAPEQRLFYTIIAMLLSAASWITSNLGGFILGLLLGLIGCSLAFAWVPRRDSAPARPESADPA